MCMVCDSETVHTCKFQTCSAPQRPPLKPALDGVRNEVVCKRVGIEREFASRVDQRVLRWFEHVEKIYEYRMGGGRVRGRPMLDG